MPLLRTATQEDGTPVFAVVADDLGADYVWVDPDQAYFNGDERLERLANLTERPTDEQGWLRLATSNLPFTLQYSTRAVTSREDGVAEARDWVADAIDKQGDSGYSPLAESTARAFDEVSQDYPTLGEGDDETDDPDPQGTLHLVLQTLGPIDPEGPNGWILRAADGEPRPGDENAFIDFSGGQK